jgi:rare lipoprotein A
MGEHWPRLDWGRIVRCGTIVAGCLVLANCSGPLTGGDSKYSQRVVEEGEPVPKGGGTYRVGQPYNVNGRDYVPAEDTKYRAEGMASWYGRDFHGRLTANREVYDMHAISAAHPTMPLPSYARVTNLGNGRSIIVRVNNRGPYSRGRIVDVSIGTARALDFYSKGVAKVRVEYVGRAPIEGSDDRMLLATLREGSPAPAPSKIMVASAKPFISNPRDRVGGPEPESDITSAIRPPSGSMLRSQAASAAETSSRPPPPSAPAAAFAPMRSEGSQLGLMSGRGLY